MFEQLRNGFESIDAVLNEELMNSINSFDIQLGFDPSKDYSLEGWKQSYFSGVEALKKSGEESSYLLLEVRLKEGSNEFVKLYLRGFNHPIDSHPTIARDFLTDEVKPILPSDVGIPYMWPRDSEVRGRYESTIERRFEGLQLTVSAVGGGEFDLKNNGINLRGYSRAFGSVRQEYQEVFKELLQQLVQKPAYNGFQVKFG